VLLARRGRLLLLRDAQRHLLAVRQLHERACLLGCRQARGNVPECDCVGAHAEAGAPSTPQLVCKDSEDWGKELHSLLRNRLGDTRHARLRERIVDLPGVSV
jgi:hypothetical protein